MNSRLLFLLSLNSLFITILAVSNSAQAFHSGGVGECDGCHTMHGYQEGFSVGMVGQYLLKGTDPGSVCLNCHQQANASGPSTYHVSTPLNEMPAGTPPKQLSPGGDFGWLKKTFNWFATAGDPVSYSYGDRHGHNINAIDYGYVQDAVNAVAAGGGGYPSDSLTCISCHDPHGSYRRSSDGSYSTTGLPISGSGSFNNSFDPVAGVTAVGVYRMLGGAGYHPRSISEGFSFLYGPPAAVAPFPANRAENASLTRVAYGQGMSEWCMNCHPYIHMEGSSFVHPSGSSAPLGIEISSYYNQYINSGDMSGRMANSYSSLVPFEIGSTNYAALKWIVTSTPTKGPDNSDGMPQVTCLTCHRAHASGWDGAMRWNPTTEYIVYNGRYSQEGEIYQPYGQGRSESEASQAYYQIPVSSFSNETSSSQGPLCHKCHVTIPK
jgi:hypothetical protein